MGQEARSANAAFAGKLDAVVFVPAHIDEGCALDSSGDKTTRSGRRTARADHAKVCTHSGDVRPAASRKKLAFWTTARRELRMSQPRELVGRGVEVKSPSRRTLDSWRDHAGKLRGYCLPEESR